jgi:hypothetical protein
MQFRLSNETSTDPTIGIRNFIDMFSRPRFRVNIPGSDQEQQQDKGCLGAHPEQTLLNKS